MANVHELRDILLEAMAMIECITTTSADPDKVSELNRRAYSILAQQAEPAPAQNVEVLGQTCIDGGTCHHACTTRCFRRECCTHFSDYTGPWAYDEPAPAQDEREAHVPDKVFQDEFQVWWEDHGQFCRAGGGDYERTFAFQAWRHLYPMLMQARATRPAQTAPQPKESGLVEALGAFVSLAEDRLHELGALSPEMAECLTDGRAALAAQGGER